MNRKTAIFLTVLFLAAVFAFTLNRFKESDSFYHLAAGKLMLATHSIPHTDVFSFTAGGHPWIAHEWLAEILLYAVWYAGGYWGVIVFCALLAVLTYALIIRRALLEGAHLSAALLLALLLGSLTFELWIGRPQIFAYLLFAAELLLLELYRRKGSNKYLWSILPLVLIWANMHASVILGVVVFAWYAIAASLKQKWPDLFGVPFFGERPVMLQRAALGAFALSFLNPNGPAVWTYNFTIQRTLGILQVEEWKPLQQFFHTDLSAQAFAVELLVISLTVLWTFLAVRKERDATSLGLVLGVAILPFISVRHAGWWPLAAIPPLAALSRDLTPRLRAALESSRTSVLVAVFGAVFLAAGIGRIPRSYFNVDTVPVHAADFIQTNNIQGPMYDHYNFGGYFIWRLWPEQKVFIDGRSEVFAGEPAADFVAIEKGEKWTELADQKYKLNYFVLPYRPAGLAQSLMNLYTNLIRAGWTFVYWDDSSVIFLRPAPENLPIAAKYAIQHVGPWTDPAAIPAAESQAAALELQKLVERSPDSTIIQDYAERFLAAHRK